MWTWENIKKTLKNWDLERKNNKNLDPTPLLPFCLIYKSLANMEPLSRDYLICNKAILKLWWPSSITCSFRESYSALSPFMLHSSDIENYMHFPKCTVPIHVLAFAPVLPLPKFLSYPWSCCLTICLEEIIQS